jgi:hypothetical protein
MIKVGLSQLPTLAFKNRHIVEYSTNAGCMYCQKIYPISEIKSYTDNQKTCLCPYCNVDAVIGDKSGYEINEKSLSNANKYWFQKK